MYNALKPKSKNKYDITSGYSLKEIPNINPNDVWKGKNESVTVQGIEISKGFIYIGENLRAINDEYTQESSLIIPSLEVIFESSLTIAKISILFHSLLISTLP